MIYGLTGVHRCGKTYLAETLAAQYDLEFRPSVIRMSFEQHGLLPDQILTWEQRFAVQNTALDNLDAAITTWEGLSCPVVFDRTPIDLVSYLLTTMVEEGGFEHEDSNAYIARARELTDRFTSILVVQPHPDLEFADEPYKGRKEAQHMRLLDTTMTTMASLRGHPVLSSKIPLEARADEAAQLLGLHKLQGGYNANSRS